MSSEPPFFLRSRRKNYWEAIYEPSLAARFTAGDWRVPELGANLKLFSASDLKAAVRDKATKLEFSEVRFVDCDFTGFFTEFGRAIVFKGCEFRRCDFGSSTWERAKFTACKFLQCSLTQSTWLDCEFRRCEWTDISMAGNETQLTRVYVENPDRFIASAYTNLDVEELARRGADPHFQKTRLEETRATVARNLYQSHREVGDDATFHKVCKVFTLQGIVARRAEFSYLRAKETGKWRRAVLGFKVGVASLELNLTKAFGGANGWGSSLSRPLGMIAITLFIFATLNALVLGDKLGVAFFKAFDVTSVAGYTKAVSLTSSFGAQGLAALNLVSALFFYTVFFSTAVAKVSRFR